MTWQFKILLALITFGTAFAGGYKAAESKLQPVITELTAQLLAIDLKAKEAEIKYKENADVIKDKDSKYRGAIAYYERMLREAANSPSAGETSKDTAGMDEAPRWPTLSGCPPEVEREFFEDTRVRAGMAEHFRLNQYPIE